MLTPEPRGVNITGALVIHGDSWQQRSRAGSIVADDATLIDAGRLSGLGRRIADFYAGLVGDFRSTQRWKRLRRTKHDHHPVHDALGNAEALIRIFDGER
jgi:hypothetical protein